MVLYRYNSFWQLVPVPLRRKFSNGSGTGTGVKIPAQAIRSGSPILPPLLCLVGRVFNFLFWSEIHTPPPPQVKILSQLQPSPSRQRLIDYLGAFCFLYFFPTANLLTYRYSCYLPFLSFAPFFFHIYSPSSPYSLPLFNIFPSGGGEGCVIFSMMYRKKFNFGHWWNFGHFLPFLLIFFQETQKAGYL
jgi:hypothetical protein